jgi:hypothetical protein
LADAKIIAADLEEAAGHHMNSDDGPKVARALIELGILDWIHAVSERSRDRVELVRWADWNRAERRADRPAA